MVERVEPLDFYSDMLGLSSGYPEGDPYLHHRAEFPGILRGV